MSCETLCLTQRTTRLHSTTESVVAENSTTPNEYGLTTAINNRLLRHRFGAEFCLHAQPANQESSSLKGVESDRVKKFNAPLLSHEGKQDNITQNKLKELSFYQTRKKRAATPCVELQQSVELRLIKVLRSGKIRLKGCEGNCLFVLFQAWEEKIISLHG